jgi:hypothetical protein
MMQKVRREIAWGGVIWFVWGIGHAVGNWLDIEALKPHKDSGLLWFGFAGMIILFVFIADCTDAILAKISERAGSESQSPDQE